MTSRAAMVFCKKDAKTDSNGNYNRYWIYVRDDN